MYIFYDQLKNATNCMQKCGIREETNNNKTHVSKVCKIYLIY